jgi:hypothetical protein
MKARSVQNRKGKRQVMATNRAKVRLPMPLQKPNSLHDDSARIGHYIRYELFSCVSYLLQIILGKPGEIARDVYILNNLSVIITQCQDWLTLHHLPQLVFGALAAFKERRLLRKR